MPIVNLDYLRNVTEGDKESMRELVDIFLDQVPEFIANMNRFLENKMYKQLGDEAHKAKSSVVLMGMEDLGRELKYLQMATISGTDEESYAGYVQSFEKQCLMAVEELKMSVQEL